MIHLFFQQSIKVLKANKPRISLVKISKREMRTSNILTSRTCAIQNMHFDLVRRCVLQRQGNLRSQCTASSPCQRNTRGAGSSLVHVNSHIAGITQTHTYTICTGVRAKNIKQLNSPQENANSTRTYKKKNFIMSITILERET